MFNFSGVFYRIWGVCGILLLVGILCILVERPWAKKVTLKDLKAGLLITVFAIGLGLVYASRILFPDVLSYTGDFVDTHRNSRVAPPLPFTREYVFWNGEGKKQVYYLDTFSKKEIFPWELEYGQQYTIYYDDFTNVIVRVEPVE